MPVDLSVEYGVPDAVNKVSAVLPGGRLDDGISYSDFEGEAQRFARALTEVCLAGDYKDSAFSSPRLICTLRKENEGKEGYEDFMLLIHEAAAKHRAINLLNLSTSHMDSLTSAHSTGIAFQAGEREHDELGRGFMVRSSLQCVTLNLPRVAYKSGGKEERFFETLQEAMSLAREVAMVKKDVISKRIERGSLSFLSQSNGAYFDLGRASNLIGYVGLNEAVKNYLGEGLHESKYARDIGVSIVKRMSEMLLEWERETGTGWLLSARDNPSIAQRFAMLDSGQFSLGVPAKGPVNSIRYTSSCHVSEEARLSPLERERTEAPFYSLNNGGMMETIKVEREGAEELLEISKGMLRIPVGHWGFAP